MGAIPKLMARESLLEVDRMALAMGNLDEHDAKQMLYYWRRCRSRAENGRGVEPEA